MLERAQVQHLKHKSIMQADDRTCRGLWAAAGDQKSRSEKMIITGSTFGETASHYLSF